MSALICGRTREDGPGSPCCLWTDEAGTTALEYALMLGLIAASALVSYYALGRVVRDDIGSMGQAVESVGGGPIDAAPRVTEAACTRPVP